MSGKPNDPCRVTTTPLEKGGIHVEVEIPTYDQERTTVSITVERDNDGDWQVFIPWPDGIAQEAQPMAIALDGVEGYEVCNGILYLGAPDVDGPVSDH